MNQPADNESILPIPQWQRPLEARGILQAALECGVGPYIQGKQSYWIYPVMTEYGKPNEIRPGMPAFRLKAMDSNAELKYFWSPKDPQDGQPWRNPNFYFAPGFLQAVEDNGGAAIYASGEPDVWAWMSAGYRNVFSWYGEQHIPKDVLIRCLKDWNVKVLYQYPDLDKTGQVSAAKLHRLLVQNEFPHNITLLPALLGEGGDINKLWIHTKFNSDGFTNTLNPIPYVDQDEEWDVKINELVRACEGKWDKVWQTALESSTDFQTQLANFWRLVIHAGLYPSGPDTSKPAPAKPRNASTDQDRDMPDEYYQAIQAALDPAMQFNSDGWSRKPFPCPMTAHTHDGEKPAAHWNQDKKILKCFKCGEAILAKQVAEALKIDYRLYLPQKQQHHRSTGLTGGKNNEPANDVPQVNFLRKSAIDHTAPSSYLPMPLKTIAALGGFCEMMENGLMTLVAGPSGSGKTSIVECIAAAWNRAGYSGIMYNPEWTDQNQMVREITRRGGPDYTKQKKHLAYHTDIAAGVPEAVVRAEGKMPMTDEEVIYRDSLVKEINAWPGEMYYVNPARTFDEILQGIEKAYAASVGDGKSARFLIFDYIQMVGYDYELIMSATNQLKNFCMTSKTIHGIIVSQFHKTGAAAAKKGEKATNGSTAYINENVFNCVLLSQRDVLENGIELPSLSVTVGKNSVGKSGQTVTLDYNPELLWVGDPAPKNLDKLEHF